MGDPGNPTSSGGGPGPEPDPEQPGWASPTPPPPPPRPPPSSPAPSPPPTWAAPPPTWGAPPPPPGAPGPPGGGAGWTPPGPAPRKRRLTWLWILIPVLLVFLTSFVIVIVFAVRLYTGPIQATNDYYTDLRYGRYTAAYRELCSLKRRQTTLAEFVAEQKSDEQTKGRVGAFDFSSSELSNDNTIIDAVTTGTVERGGSEYDVKVSLRKEDGDWKVCNAAER